MACPVHHMARCRRTDLSHARHDLGTGEAQADDQTVRLFCLPAVQPSTAYPSAGVQRGPALPFAVPALAERHGDVCETQW